MPDILSPELLNALRCPQSQQPLRLATADELARFPGAPEAGLIREDGRLLYPVRDGFPVLLVDDALEIPL
ncbi:hypothetical protein BH23VER1_BH23VER1_30800 [soil metagenome]